jgi:Bacterial antitoxin of type II TA system, VapB
MLDEQLLAEATALSGERTFSRTIERALQEMVKRLKARRLLDLAGSGIWQGDLAAMRGDRSAAVYSPSGAAEPSAVHERPAVYRPRAKARRPR